MGIRTNFNTRVPVVVVYRGGIGALSIARTLGRLGVRVYLIAERDNSPVWHSRYWAKKYAWDFSYGDEATLEFFLNVGRDIGAPAVLLTLVDSVAIFIEQNAEALATRFIFPIGAPNVVKHLANKFDMFALAKQHGIPTPETAFPQSRDDVVRFAQTAQFPIIMKGADPLLPRAAAKQIVWNASELLDAYDQAAASGAVNAVLQEYIPGDAETVWMCNAYFGKDSDCKAIFTGKKLRQVSSTGIASLAECVPNATVEEQTRRFMQAVGYQGAVGIGWRYDERDGKYKVLDVNARVSGVFRLFRATNHMDVVRIAYLDLTGQAIPTTALTVGRKWMLEQDVDAAIAAARGGHLTFKQWLRSIRGVQETHWFALDDPLPFVKWLSKRLRPQPT